MRSRSLVFVVGGLVVAAIGAAAIAYWYPVLQPRLAPPISVALAPASPTPASSSPAAAPPAAPSAATPTAAAAPTAASTPAFDIVRVEPSGDTLVAGRAAPGAKVELSDGGKAIGDAAANDAGQFVILPSPLSPGRHPLRLSAKVEGGAPQLSDVVVVEVAGAPAVAAAPPAAKPAPAAVQPTPQATVAAAPAPTSTSSPAASAAASTPSPAASAAASTPSPAASAAAAAPAAAPAPTPTPMIVVAVASVRPVDPAGLEAVGSAPPAAHVRLRLNNAVLAEVVAGVDGVWRLTIERGLTAGDYALEAAVVDAAGNVLARAESPFVYPEREVVATATPPASPSQTESPKVSSPQASLSAAAAEPSPAASTPAAPALAASTSGAATGPTPSPTGAIAAAEPTPAASAEAAPAAPARTASVAGQPAPSAPAAAETPAASEAPAATPSHAVVAEVSTYTVVKGDNLWDLAIKYYGDGLRYADIFSANASQIRNPNLIYIGQIFVVPPKPTTNPPSAR